MPTNLQRPDCRPFAWARNSLLPVPGAYAPGFMLTPAPQAKSRFFVQGRMKLYVYCLAEAVDRLDKTLCGVSGEPVRIASFEDLSALVSVCRSDAFKVTRKNVLAHHEVVRSITKQTTPLPARFGTLVTVQQLGNYVSTHQQAIKARLAHVRGRVEMNVRMISTITGPDTSQDSKNEIVSGPGTAFLLEKQRALLRKEAGVAQ